MQQKWIPSLCLCHLNVVLLAKLQFFSVGNTFCTIMEKSGQLCCLNIVFITHGKGCTGIHDSKCMLIAAIVHLVLYFLLISLHIIMFHPKIPHFLWFSQYKFCSRI